MRRRRHNALDPQCRRNWNSGDLTIAPWTAGAGVLVVEQRCATCRHSDDQSPVRLFFGGDA